MRRYAAAAYLVATCAVAAAEDTPVVASFLGLDVVASPNRIFVAVRTPPKLDHVNVALAVRDNRVHEIEIKTLALAGACRHPRARASQRLRVTGYELRRAGDAPVTGTASVRTRTGDARDYMLRVNIDSVSTSATSPVCDLALDMIVDRVRTQLTLPLAVVEEPRLF